ncbi:MAG: hypothetical protein EBW87_01710 [Burkholderiaceae bacterium]|nr:hypothetical protein [Burkholderiaceae bacterium]
MTIEAMKQALEALEYLATQIKPDYEHSKAITSLRQAIEQAEKQEPVAFNAGVPPLYPEMKDGETISVEYTTPPAAPVQQQKPVCWDDEDKCPNRQACCDAEECLYTTPQPQEFVCSTGLCHFTLTQTNVGIGERGMEAYEAAKERGWVGLSDERLMEMPKQEPVAKAWDEGYRAGINDERMSEANIGIAGFNAKVEPARNNPYLTTPQPQREWVGLTNEEIQQACYETFSYDPYVIASAIEAKLKEKNT